MCGCALAIFTPALTARRRKRRVAAWRSIRPPRMLRRIGPLARSPTARSMARPTAGGSGINTTLVPLPHTRSTRWPCSSPRSVTSAPVASKIRKPSRPSMATKAKSQGLPDWRVAVSRASNCKCVNPGAGDSAGTVGRRTCPAGECSRMPSMTQVRQNPAVIENRRETADALNRRISCIHRMYSSRCGRHAASGSRPRAAHQARKQHRSDSV
jgi:hypothetical protein